VRVLGPSYRADQGRQVDGLGGAGRVLGAQPGRQRAQHLLQLVDIAADHGPDVLGLDIVGRQLQAGQGGAQVVAERFHRPGLVLDQAGDALLHVVEGAAQLGQVRRPLDGDRLGRPLAHPAGGLGQAPQRLAQLAQGVGAHAGQGEGERGGHRPQGDRPGTREVARAERQPAAVAQAHGADEIAAAVRLVLRPQPQGPPGQARLPLADIADDGVGLAGLGAGLGRGLGRGGDDLGLEVARGHHPFEVGLVGQAADAVAHHQQFGDAAGVVLAQGLAVDRLVEGDAGRQLHEHDRRHHQDGAADQAPGPL
jgi:hypothetical protein